MPTEWRRGLRTDKGLEHRLVKQRCSNGCKGWKNNKKNSKYCGLGSRHDGVGEHRRNSQGEGNILRLRYLELMLVYVSRCQNVSPVDNILDAGLTFFLGHVDTETATETLMNESSLKIQWRCPPLSSIMDNYFVVQWKLISTPPFLFLSHNRHNYISHSRWYN